MEDVTSYFHSGLAESVRPNPISRQGIPTCLTLSRTTPLAVNYIMGVAAIPRGWGWVSSITPESGAVVLQSAKGKAVKVPLNCGFLYSEP
jgi:hypothetical protein